MSNQRKQQRPKGMFARLWPYMKKRMWLLGLCCLMVLVVNFAELAKPYILEIAIDRFLVTGRADQGFDAVWVLALGYLLCAGIGSLMNVSEAVLVNKTGQTILLDLRRDVFRHIQHMPMSALDQHSSGRLITRATNDVEALNELFSDVLVNLFKDVFLLIGIVVTMFLMNWQLALVALTGLPLVAVITFYVRARLRKNFKIIKSLTGRINGFLAENLAGMRLVQIFRREKEKMRQFDGMNNAYYKAALTQVRMNSFMGPAMEAVNSLVIAAILWFGCRQIGIDAGFVEVGVLYAFTTYIKQFFQPINDLAEKYATIQSAAVSTDRIFELLDDHLDEEQPDEGNALQSRPLGRIEFEHVWFAYTCAEGMQGEEPRWNWVLRDVSFTIEPGQSVAFVGETGAGKTTIISLVSRFYEIQKGRILLDGVDITTLSKRSLRKTVAVVLQDVFLFSGSIRENVRLGDSAISDSAVDEALALTCADGFISKLPGGMDYTVTENGSTFSAGQRQLISFARAIAHDPAVFILDEATAAIDTQTEELIQRSVKNMKVGRTTIIIAHRLSTIRDCDNILVMAHGRLAEQGTHEQLLKLGGIYANLHNRV